MGKGFTEEGDYRLGFDGCVRVPDMGPEESVLLTEQTGAKAQRQEGAGGLGEDHFGKKGSGMRLKKQPALCRGDLLVGGCICCAP